MLQSVRDNIRGWVAWVVVIFLSIPFALFGINSYFEGTFADNVAEVEGEEISNREFRDRYQSQLQQLRQQRGEDFDMAEVDEASLRREVLDAMIRQRLMAHRASEHRYEVDESQVAREIRNIPAFQENGQFSMERYRNLLRAQGMGTSEFEAQVRMDLQVDAIRSGIMRSSFVTQAEIERLFALEQQQRRMSFVDLVTDRYLEEVEVTDEEIEDEYSRNQDEFRTEEQVDLEYIMLSLERLREQVEISEEELRQAWERDRERYREDEERRARHILLEDDDGAMERARDLRERIAEGESFEELAAEYSVDGGSADEGGDLGWVRSGDLVEEVNEALFAMEEGELSEPVRSDFGVHLIRLDRIRTPQVKAFEDAREELARDLRERRAEERYFDLREQLADRAFEFQDELEPLADLVDGEVRTVEGVTRDDGEGIGRYRDVRREAFSDPVLEEAFNSDPIELDDDRVVVFRLLAHRPSEQLALDEVREQVAERLRQRKASERLREEAETLVERARTEGSLAAALEGTDLEASEPRWVERNDPSVAPELREQLFRMARPAPDEIRVNTLEREDGHISLIALHGVEDEAFAELDEQTRMQQRIMRGQQRGMFEYDAYARELRERGDVEVMMEEDEDPMEVDGPPEDGDPPPAPEQQAPPGG